jgi:hypothetical protein
VDTLSPEHCGHGRSSATGTPGMADNSLPIIVTNIALSRRKQGFESPRERQQYQLLMLMGRRWCPVCVPSRYQIPRAEHSSNRISSSKQGSSPPKGAPIVPASGARVLDSARSRIFCIEPACNPVTWRIKARQKPPIPGEVNHTDGGERGAPHRAPTTSRHPVVNPPTTIIDQAAVYRHGWLPQRHHTVHR